MHSTNGDQHLGAEEDQIVAMSPTAREVQRQESSRTGKYQCELCRTTFEYKSSEKEIVCPKCHNDKADSLTSLYIPDDPQSSEMMTRDEYAAGD
jgi:protein-arginine kinase activator protein McsA